MRKNFCQKCFAWPNSDSRPLFGEGYWVDHWTYNLDLIESYLAVYPEEKRKSPFGKAIYTFYDSPAVKPRAENMCWWRVARASLNRIAITKKRRR